MSEMPKKRGTAVSLTSTPEPHRGDVGTLAALRRLDDWDGLPAINSIVTGLKRRPNLFPVAPRILHVEGIHSDLLAWMLDPKQWHGLGDRFACAFVRATLEACDRRCESPITVVDVEIEASTGQGPIDILLRLRIGDSHTVLGIENKIHSPEGDKQLKRYGDGLALRLSSNETLVLAFLTPDGRKPNEELPKCPVGSISYRTVARLLEDATVAVADEAGVGLEIVRQYTDALRTNVMNESNAEIDALCRSLLKKHPEAWRAIRRRLPSRRDDWHAALGEAVCKRLEADNHGHWRFAVRRDKYACVFRDEWFGLGEFETDSLLDASQGAAPVSRYPRVHFRLVADGSDVDADDDFRYALRLKLDTRQQPEVGRSLIESLQSIEALRARIPERDQWTVALKSTSNLPALGDEPSAVPDSVVAWYARHIIPFVPPIDAVFRNDRAPRGRQ